jgi:tRNA pseudouridine32 synthase/23S rRNA pseudouridine746 synthase
VIFHPLHTDIQAPERFNNPFYYEPHPLCLLAIEQLKAQLSQSVYKEEIDQGKMFGVLVVAYHGQMGYLQAYSGQITAIDENAKQLQNTDSEFVPAVFDYLQPTGYFKTHEAEISAINHQIEALENSEDYLKSQKQLAILKSEAGQKIADYRLFMKDCKAKRDSLRDAADADKEALIRESQFQKAEFRRLKKQFEEKIAHQITNLEKWKGEIEALKRLRKMKSDALQGWLFAQFRMLNGKGESKNLSDIFQSYFTQSYNQTPPSGAGECCEPKLLQYAYMNGMKPLCMAMFWWGESPKAEIRHHLQFYPACQGKCKPILTWMLQGLEVEDNPLEQDSKQSLEIIFEDTDILVINKPAGMLSVPGKSKRQSVLSLVREHCQNAEDPMIVHRLDMATSGLLVVAKNRLSYLHLQRQFKEHTIIKRYIALLTPTSSPISTKTGVIDLPLRANLDDRPRQMVDFEKGKTAITEYEFLSNDRIAFYPKTGRTHQLRVHCAHREGLNRPILGDELYGKRADRLYLHAAYLEFTHPTSGKRIHFEKQPDF